MRAVFSSSDTVVASQQIQSYPQEDEVSQADNSWSSRDEWRIEDENDQDDLVPLVDEDIDEGVTKQKSQGQDGWSR